MPKPSRARARPKIYVIASEADAISELASAAQSSNPLVCELLLDELSRAKALAPDAMPADVVRMHSRVEYLDESSGRRRMLQLVFPGEADSDAGRISVLTPVGAALIGMRAGAKIDWPDLAGGHRVLRILTVSQPPAKPKAA